MGVENENILRFFSLIHKIVVNLCRTVKARQQSCRETSSIHEDRSKSSGIESSTRSLSVNPTMVGSCLMCHPALDLRHNLNGHIA